MRVSLVIPVHNEAENIASLAQEISRVLCAKHSYEIIFVDDGSQDQTPMTLSFLQQRIPTVHPVYHLRHYGQSAALLTGIKHALHPVIVTMDGDGQNDPEDIDALLKVYERSETPARSVMVTGFRRQRCDTRWRKLSSRIANTVRSRLLGDGIPDSGCGLKVFSRDLFDNLPTFDHMHRFLPSLVNCVGGKIISVDVNHRPRSAGRSHYGTLDRLAAGIVDLLGVMWLMRRVIVPKTIGVSSDSGRRSEEDGKTRPGWPRVIAN
jgi:dolichol-phosphate mannosyltransferase